MVAEGRFAAASGAGSMLVMVIMASSLSLYQSYSSKILVISFLVFSVCISIFSFRIFTKDLSYLRIVSWMVAISSSFMVLVLAFLL